MNNTIAARVIRTLDTEVESAGWRSLLLGQKIITDTSNKKNKTKKTQLEQFQNQISKS